MPEKGEPPENEWSCLVLGAVGGGGSQREVNLQKMSGRARFRVMVVAREVNLPKTSGHARFQNVQTSGRFGLTGHTTSGSWT